MTDAAILDAYRGRQVLVVGGLGFIGLNLIQHLKRTGARLRALASERAQRALAANQIGSLDEHLLTLRNIREAATRFDQPIAVLGDLCGPKIRLGPISNVDGAGGMPVRVGDCLAIQREPEKRYASAADFEADIRRYMDSRPVQARSGRMHSAISLLSRNRSTAAILAAVVLLTAGVLIYSQIRSRSVGADDPESGQAGWP